MDVFEKFKEAILREKKDQLQKIDKLLQPYFLEHMHTKNNFESSSSKAIKSHIKGASKVGKLRNKPNKTNELYKLTGDLTRALTRGGRGNLSEIGADGSFTFAIDLNEIPYARIHEYGGTAGRGSQIPARPYVRPALKDFVATELPAMAQRVVDAALRSL